MSEVDIESDPARKLSSERPNEGSFPQEETKVDEAFPAKDAYLVEWDGPDDPENPQNFPRWRKWLITWMFSSLTIWVTFSSSVFSGATLPTSKLFHISTKVMTLGVSFTVLVCSTSAACSVSIINAFPGIRNGTIGMGPYVRSMGKKFPIFFGYALFAIFQIPVGVAQNSETIMLCRFFVGFFGTSSLAVIGGALADFWGPVDRAIAIALFSAATFVGPVLGPIIGGFLSESYLTWRWTAWITMIPASVFGLVALIFIPETYHPLLLKRRAARLRVSTKNFAYHSPLDLVNLTARDIMTKYLFRPCQMLVMEPILLFITTYISLIYGILYLFFVAYPISFRQDRKWPSAGVAALPLLGIMIGVFIGVAFVYVATKVWFARRLEKAGKVVPEDRLPPMMVGGVVLPIGLFWFAWTSNPGIPWGAQVVAGIPIGMGIMTIWMQGLNYLIDVYMMFANSAISGNTLIRSTIGAGFPLFATPMYHGLGVAWATSLLAFISVAMIPIPLVFYRYGAKIRAMSRYTPKL